MLGVVRTLHKRAEVVISEDTDLNSKIYHVNNALKRCNYPIRDGLSKILRKLGIERKEVKIKKENT